MTDSFQENHSQGADQSTEAGTFTSETTFTQPIKVGDRTFSSADDVIKYYEHSQKFIETLKAEKAQVEGSLSDARKVDDILAKLEQAQSTVKDAQGTDQPTAAPSNNLPDIEALLEAKLKQRETQQAETRNYNECVSRAKAELGEKWASILDNKSKELGTNLAQLAKTNPALFNIAVFGTAAKPSTTPMASSIHSARPKLKADLSDLGEVASKTPPSSRAGRTNLYAEAMKRLLQ